MKFSIRTMQSGGGMPPFTYYEPVMVNDQSATTTTSTPSTNASSSGSITDKDLLEMLGKIDGLPSDMNAIFDSISTIYELPSVSASSLNQRYLQALQNVKIATFNKKEFDKAYKIVNDNGGLNEVAITDQGKLVVTDSKGKISSITIDTYNKNRDKYQALTNSNLLDLRAQNHPMDNSLLNVVSNGIGMESVNKYIQSIALKLGNSQETIEGYSQTSGDRIVKGIQFLKSLPEDSLNGMTIDGLYHSSKATSSQIAQAKAALNYIYATMPSNMKTLLEVKSGDKEGVINLIGQLVNSGLDASQKISTQLVLDDDGNKLGSKGKTSSSSESKDHTDLSPALAFVAGKGEQKSILLNPGSAYAINTNGVYGIATGADGHALGAGASLKDLSKGQLALNLDFKQATMGGAKINPGMYDRIILNDSTIVSMDLPIKEDEITGLISPDFSLCKKLETANVTLQRQGINPDAPKSQEEINTINEIYNKSGLPVKYNQQGQLNPQQWKRFAAIQGKADERVFGKDPTFENDTIIQVTDSDQIEAFEQSIKSINKEYSRSSGIFGFGADDIYEGTIFIPLSDNLVSASLLSSDKFTVPISDASQVEAEQHGISSEQYNKIKQYNNPGNLSQFI